MTLIQSIQAIIRHEAQRIRMFGHAESTAVEILSARGI